MNEIVAKIRDTYTIVQTANTDGTTSSKIVNTDDFCNSLGSRKVKHLIYLPEGCRAVSEIGNSVHMLFTYKQHIHKTAVLWGSTLSSKYGDFRDCIPTKEEFATMDKERCKEASGYRIFNIPYPETAFIVNCRKVQDPSAPDKYKYDLCGVSAYAIKNSFLPVHSIDTYEWPFPNVFASAECCLGHNHYSVNGIEAANFFPTLIFNGCYNGDLSRGSKNFRQGVSAEYPKIDTSYHLLAMLQGKDKFPSEILVKNGNLGLAFENISNY